MTRWPFYETGTNFLDARLGLIAKDNSVWVDVNRMLHGHISIPIVGGLVLFYNSVFVYAFVSIFLPVYLLFVVLATLITVMASRASGPSTTPSAPGPASSA